MNSSTPAKAENAGATIYNPVTLAIYDLYVLRFSNYLAWRCPTSKMLELYNSNLSGDHLDIGPGSGWYLREAVYPAAAPAVTLFDLNPHSLAMTTRRLQRRGIRPTRLVGNVLEPLGVSRRFPSVAANFLMHCVPGSWTQKGIAFRHIADVTADDGVFFGSSILAHGVPGNPLSRVIAYVYNTRTRTFHNAADDHDGLEAALLRAFAEVDITVIGCVAIWTARAPRRAVGG